jgi:hypothetical protein
MPRKTRRNRSAGRPPKFLEPSRPITVTLPERTLKDLRKLGPDRAQAIVAAVDHLVGEPAPEGTPLMKVVDMAPGVGLLVLPYCGTLTQIPWLTLIKIIAGQYLLTVTPGVPIEKVEVALMDLIANARDKEPEEIPILEELRNLIGDFRRGERISKAEILVVTQDGAVASEPRL